MGPKPSHRPVTHSSRRILLSSTATERELRRQSSSSSTTSQPSSSILPHTSPKVQLIPYSRTESFDVALTEVQRTLLDGTSFDLLDLSSQDFEFEDIFTYDKPQKKLSKVVEVATRERGWSNFSFPHYTAAMAARVEVNRKKSGIPDKSLKNQMAQTMGKEA